MVAIESGKTADSGKGTGSDRLPLSTEEASGEGRRSDRLGMANSAVSHRPGAYQLGPRDLLACAATPKVVAHLWRLVVKTDTCWNWIGPTRGRLSHGALWLSGRRVIYPHRLSYALHYGIEPGRLCVCHHCDNSACVRPDHLFLGTLLDNIRDCNEKGRNAKGERAGNVKFGESQARQILQRYAFGDGAKAMAVEHGVTERTIYNLITGARWADLGDREEIRRQHRSAARRRRLALTAKANPTPATPAQGASHV